LTAKIYTVLDKTLSLYSFPGHPFNGQRYFTFKSALEKKDLIKSLGQIQAREATQRELLLFHTREYIEFVKEKDGKGGYLDFGDTPAFKGIFKASRIVTGTTLNSIDKAVQENTKVFTPVGGLHHAFKNRAGGFCVFNDICIGINYLREKHKIENILYFDIDAHHGDGVYYSFASEPNIFIVDFHQKGIFPGTGGKIETGTGKALGTKLNIEFEVGAEDKDFLEGLEKAKEFLNKIKVEFILFQAGCDSLKGDPITYLNFTERVHRETTALLSALADRQANGRMIILGGGGYLLLNIEKAWIAVIEELLK